MRYHRLVLAILVAFPSVSWASEPMEPVSPGRSATIARDIGGFSLGDPIQVLIKRTNVRQVQGELFEVKVAGVAYEFGVCPTGRIYRIESSQPLGRFVADKVFMDTVAAKLAAKFGPPTDGPNDNLSWELVELVRYSDGKVHPFKTNWASAIISGSGGDDVTLDLKMIDFRVCWSDEFRANRKPRDDAAKRVTL